MRTNFDNIPDGASDEEINMYISAFLNEKDNMINENGLIYTMEQLERIAECEPVNDYEKEQIREISKFIEEVLDYNNDELIDLVLTIVIQMHLDSVWNKIITANNITNKKVVDLISEAKRENSKYKYFNTLYF